MQRGALWRRVVETTRQALDSGALQPIATRTELVHDAGVPFVTRLVTGIGHKLQVTRDQREQNVDPFSQYEVDLFVAQVSTTHYALLNKFNVLDHHFLIIPYEFEDQEEWLTERDFEALWTCLGELDGLGFYNGGKDSGASQSHKHLQVVPLPLADPGPHLPMAPLLEDARLDSAGVGTVAGWPFAHAVAPVEPAWLASPGEGAVAAMDVYASLLRAVGLIDGGISAGRQTGPYNLIVTREWMWLVPRSGESYRSIFVNALGYAGAMLVRNEKKLETLKREGPMRILTAVANPR